MDKSPAQFVEDTGASAIATALGMKPAAVRMWKLRNRIPRTAWPDLIERVPGVTLDSLRKLEAAGKVAA